MNLTFVHLPEFVGDWNHYRLSDEDLQALELQLQKSPEAGVVMPGTGGVRKIRFSPPSHHGGKSGAYRVSYVFFRIGDVIVLLSIFAKKDQANLTAAQKSYYKQLVQLLKPKE